MALKLNTPLYIEQAECWIFPDAANVTSEDRLFIVCDNNALAETLIANLNELLSRHSLTPVQLSELTDDIITTGNKDFSSSSLVLLLVNKSSCLTLQMGKSRIVHISPVTGDIEYDSSNHILDSYSSKAKTQLINRINRDDVIILTLADRVDTQRLLNMVCISPFDDESSLLNRLSSLLGKHREQPPATYYLRFARTGSVGAKLNNFIKDINWKWLVIFFALAALIAGVSILSLSGHLLRFTSDDQRVDQPIDSDSINAPAPAIQDISDINEVNDVTIKASNDSIKPRQEIVKDEAPKEKVESQKPEIKNDVETEPVKPVEPDQVEPAIPQVSPTPVPDNPTE